MEIGNPRDPLLLQVLPLGAEEQPSPGFSADPLDEFKLAGSTGLIRKYEARDLLITTGACPVHCRYCFRRHFPYSGATSGGDFHELVERLGEGSTPELILSGGDPLTLGNARLGRLISALKQVKGLRRLRIHTRFPIVLPSRIDNGLLETMADASVFKLVVVLHCNHPRELDASVAEALCRLKEYDVLLLNQAVLLKGINDDPDVQIALAEGLFEVGVLPYYLHLLDPIAGAAHFQVDERRAIEIHQAAASRLPGYLLPKLVRELPGASGKTLLT